MTTRTYRERAQPAGRKRVGLLEKKKDYSLRAKNFNSKKQRLHEMQLKARNRNPDEFYFKMNSSKTKKGIHSATNTENIIDKDVLKLLKTQDLNYINTVLQTESKVVDKLQMDISSVKCKPKHYCFTENGKQSVKRDENTNISKSKEKQLSQRADRLKQLAIARDRLILEKNLALKGSKHKIGQDERGIPIYKWKNQRQK